jgi:hypothetical protein
MDKQQLKQFILENNVISYGKKQIYVKPTKLKNVMSFIDLYTKNCREDISEKVYWILNNIDDYPKCKNCGNIFKSRFHGFKHGYKDIKYCSQICVNTCEEYKSNKMSQNLQRIGYEHVSQNPEFKNNIIQNNLIKYGKEHYFQTIEFKQKNHDTFIEKYNCSNAMHVPEFFEKCNRYRIKQMSMPSGKIINYQGYEHIAINELLQIYEEDNIIVSRDNVPNIYYYFNGKKKKYYPDIFIPSENLIIEVKSEYTYKKYFEINELKREAVLKLNYNFNYWICSDKCVLNKITKF